MFDNHANCLMVLRKLHPGLSTHVYISLNEVAELWRESLYTILRLCSQSVHIQAFKLWVERYCQISILTFPKKTALNPYQLKIVLYYQILKQGYLSCTWSHLTESLEKSDPHAQKFFYSKNLMGGGRLHHQNHRLLDSSFSFCLWLPISENSDEKK